MHRTTPGAPGSSELPAKQGHLGDGRSPFVGRELELDELMSAVDSAIDGHGRVVLVAGEPGIGKSRLADQAARLASGRGARILWGRCWEAGGAPAYWPWVQSIRSYIRTQGREALRAEMGAGASDIAQMMPEVRDLFSDLPAVPTVDPEAARFRLFDSTSTFLRNAADTQPIVLILDDLHAADAPSLLLLRFMASEVGRTRQVIIGAYRDAAVDPDHPISSTLTELAREPAVRRLALKGLAERDVARYMELATGSPPPPSVVSAVQQETEGNPLFVGEVVRLLASEGRLDHVSGSRRMAVPESVREVIGRRLEHLSEPCREVLGLASVLGREFSLDALKRLKGGPTSEILDVLGEAAEARVVTDAPGTLGRVRFSHALIRDALYEGLLLPRRLELHRRAGETLQHLYASELDLHLAELAHHFFEAAPAGQAEKAALFARRAGDRAATLLAYEEATRLYGMALQVLGLQERPDPGEHCDLLVALGDAQTKAGDGPSAKETFLRAAEIARAHQMPERLAEAALGYGGRFVWLRPGIDTRMVPLLQEALAALGEGDSRLKISLMARLAGALRDQPTREPRASLSREALEMARRIGDPPTLAYALVSRFAANWGPENDAERLELAAELVQVAEEIGDLDREIEGRLLLVKVLMTLGDLTGLYRELGACERLVAVRRQPSQQWYVECDRVCLSLFEGRFAQAENMITEVRNLGERAEGMGAHVAYRLQMFQLRKEQGRLAEMEEVIRRSVTDYPWYPLFRCVLANLLARSGRSGEARRVFDDLAADAFAALPRDNEWLFAMSFLPEVAELLGDEGRAGVLYDLLLPFSGRNAYSPPELCTGPVSRYLGMLSAARGRWKEAESRYEEALEMAVRMGARPWAAHTQHDLARILVSRQGPGDRDRAIELLRSAQAAAGEIGMPALDRQLTVLLMDLGVSSEPERTAGTPAAEAPGTAVFRREGDSWSIAYDGRGFRLKDAKGLHYIHRLLVEPGREFHVAELASESQRAATPVAADGLRIESGHAGEILDPRARSEYQRRIQDLREEVEEASRWGDREREARAQEELDFISRELASAYGLGGRPRRAAEGAERIRKAVTNRIRDSLSRIEKEHPTLGRHLDNAIATGTFCSYAPDRPLRWEL